MPALFPAWSSIIGFVLGAFFGSFLNMAIYRLPRGLSFVNPSRSFCPRCKHSLASTDLVPILSWVVARGRCRYCQEPVSSRYLWVEILTGSLFAAIWWRYLTDVYDPIRAGIYLVVTLCLVAIIFIDAELFIIPDELNVLILIAAVVYHWSQGNLSVALTGGLLGWGLLFGVQLLGRVMFGKDAMGDGDIKMMRSVGALLGPLLLLGNFGIAVVVGLIGGVIGIVMAKRAAGGNSEPDVDEPMPTPTPIPFMLISGAWYLLCLDVVAVFVPPLRRWVDARIPPELIEEEDDWKPSATTIPFGPYLAVGALVCMIFAAVIEGSLKNYFRVSPSDSGPAVVSPINEASGLFRGTPSRLN